MADASESSWDKAVALNCERRKVRFEQGRQAGATWLVECRDLFDAYDDDAGVYFCICSSEAEVDELVTGMDENSPDRILGIYSLCRPLEPQGPGYSRNEWLQGRQ